MKNEIQLKIRGALLVLLVLGFVILGAQYSLINDNFNAFIAVLSAIIISVGTIFYIYRKREDIKEGLPIEDERIFEK